jgi:hypothetical protein
MTDPDSPLYQSILESLRLQVDWPQDVSLETRAATIASNLLNEAARTPLPPGFPSLDL